MKKSLIKLVIMLVLPALVMQAAGPSFVALAAEFPRVDIVEGEASQKRVYDLIVLVVDKKVADDRVLGSVVNRYAEDLVDNYDQTDVQFLIYDERKDGVEDLAKALEKFYFEGGGEHENVLQGVVLIGDVPLPVVNKNGNRFISMFPYTDFEQKAYVFEVESGDFVLNGESREVKPEVWHGIINGSDEELGAFFEKNHAYYEGDPEYREFDRKLFFGDLVNEEKQLNDDSYQRYLEYEKSAEDLVYNRYNKHWAKALNGETTEGLDLDNENIVGAEWLRNLQESDIFGKMADFPQSMVAIQQALVPYVTIFGRYNSSLNDWADYTGRYQASDVDSVPKLMTGKDEYSKAYLKNVNDALERAVDRVAEKISKPLPLLSSVELSGSFPGDESFLLNVTDNKAGESFGVTSQNLNFHYLNGVDGKFYVNGVASDNLVTAKLCSVFLGSTKEEYFDENLGFDPKRVDGEYSILTRSLRSDDLNTSYLQPTAGVSTRGTAEGFVIEGKKEYGVPAFFHSALAGRSEQYRGAFERNFQEGDVIKAINGKVLSGDYTFDQAIEENYFNVSKVIQAVNDDRFELLNGVKGNLAVLYRGEPAEEGQEGVLETKVLESNLEMFGDEVLRGGRVRSVLGYLEMDFVRDGEEREGRLTFTVTADGPILFPSTEDPKGSDGRAPERVPIQVVVYPETMSFPANYQWDRRSNGAIFALYDNRNVGYASRPYDVSAGCNANATSRNSDRCLGRFASLPVLSPAGSIAPQAVNVPGEGVSLEFPERVKVTNDLENSGRVVDHEDAVDLYDFPLVGQRFDDVDEYIMDACYGMPLPAVKARNGKSSNPFAYVLDPTQGEAPLNGIGEDLSEDIQEDFYGRLLKSIGFYVGGRMAGEVDYVERPGISEVSDFSPADDLWLSYDAIDASEIVLHSDNSEKVTLKDFADRYGMIDGKDNDGDGVADYVVRGGERVYDFDEANPIYGIRNLPEIARKMLAYEKRFLIPYGSNDFPEEWRKFPQDIELLVKPKVVKEVSSLIRHNEPTDYTIAEQARLGITKDLPIDNPRYLAFESMGGEVEKVNYVNLFDEKLSSFPRLQVSLLQKANELAAVEGSYRIFGEDAEEGDFTEGEIAQEILTRYLAPVVTSVSDSPVSGFDLVRAETRKVADALEWINSGVDEKHSYILRNYLNDGDGYRAYISEPEKGYEASYLVLDGEEDLATLAFDREVVEKDQRFDPIGSRLLEAEVDDDVRRAAGEDDFDFVWLDQFLDELKRFKDSFTYEPNFEQSCGYSEFLDGLLNGEAAVAKKKSGGLEVKVAQTVVAKDGEEIVVETDLFDEDGEVLRSSDETFALEVSQNGNVVKPVTGSQVVSPTGKLRFNLVSGDKAGVATVKVVSSTGVSSNALQLEVSGKELSVSGESEIVAGSEEVLEVQVQMLDVDGQPLVEDGAEVSLSAEGGLLEVLDGGVVSGGVANFRLKAGTKAGAVELVARVVGDDSFPVGKKVVNVVAAEPSGLSVSSESFVLVANSQSKTRLNIELRDRFGNLANNDFSKVAVFYNSLLDVDKKLDVDPNFIGLQLSTLEGVASFDLQAKNVVGTGTLVAVLLDYNLEQEILAEDGDVSDIDFENRVGARISLDVVDKLDLEVGVLNREFQEVGGVVANGETVLRLQPSLFYRGRVVEKYNGPIEFKVLTPELAHFKGVPPEKMVNGELAAGNILLEVGTIAGELAVEVNVPGMVRKVVKVALKAGPATKVETLLSKESLKSADDELFLQARLVDEFGNLAEGDNGRRVDFEATGASERLVEIESVNVASEGGSATTKVKSLGRSGQANIIVKAEGLGESLVSVGIKKELGLDEIKEFGPKSLYVSVLGGDFGNGLKEENVAEALLFSGKGQAVSAMSSKKDGAKRLLSVDRQGRVAVLEGTLESRVVLANEGFPYQRVSFSDPIAGEELASVFVVPKADLELKTEGEGGEGIYLEDVGEGFELVEEERAMHLVKDGERVVTVDRFGRLVIGNSNYKAELVEGDGLSFAVLEKGLVILKVVIRQDLGTEVKVLPKAVVLNNFFPGVYVQMASEGERFGLVPSLSGNSTKDGVGMVLVDNENELDANQKADVPDNFGYGFENQNKYMLLFAAGNSVGEANLPYMSEATLIYGDPMVRLDNQTGLRSALSGFTKDLGKPLLSSKKVIEQMVDFDFNGDGKDDVLVLYEDGSGRLMENVIGNDKLVDRGEVLQVFGKVMSLARMDVNNDGLDDLVVGTTESCHVNDECISLYENVGGGFERKVLRLDLEGQKVYQMEGRDLNVDGCSDLTVSDSAGRVYSFYNRLVDGECGGLEERPAKRFDFGYKVSGEEDLAGNLFVSYAGMVEVAGKMVEFILRNGEVDRRVSLVHLPADGNLGGSKKVMVDVNGGSLMVGDLVDVIITLKNSGGGLNNVLISDTTPAAFSLVEGSLSDGLSFEETGVNGRERLIAGVGVAAGGEAVVKYQVKVEALPEVSFMIGNSFVDYPSDDNDQYLDFLVKTGGKVSYLYSTGLDSAGRVVHRNFEPAARVAADRRENDVVADSVNNPGEVSEDLADEIARLRNEQTADRDYNGVPDSYDQSGGKGENLAEKISNKLENVINTFRCSGGGCFPTPYNRAFLVPDGPVPGIAAFAAGLPEPPFVATAYPSSAPSTFRLYLSPTLSGGLGTAVCFGQAIGHTSPCFAYAIPPVITGVAGVCEELLGHVEEVLEKAKEAVVDAQSGMTLIVSDGQIDSAAGMAEVLQNGQGDLGNEGLNFEGVLNDADDPISLNAKANVRIPGFPSFFTDWVDNQIDEIYNKLLDFPKFYLILPDLGEFVLGNTEAIGDVQFSGFNDFARSIAAIPLVEIETKEILVRVPSISRQEVDKYKTQWEFWKKHLKKQLDDRLAVWNCDENRSKRSVCDKVTVDVNKLVASVNELMDAVDRVANFPRDLLNYRNLEGKYALQIVCYLDAITAYTGGYIKKQSLVIESWMRAIQDAIRTFKDWRVILDVMVEYQESCDRCRNDRFSKLSLLLNFFAVIPDLPVVELPKWPDIVVDLSKVKTGVKILWPDVVFRPEAIVLPDLPEIILPEILPSVRIDIPGFDVPDLPKLELPDLPDLPPLPLPSLPDLPLPPRIPPLPKFIAKFMGDLRPIFKILCLLKTGLIPVPESGLATEIETLTQPSVQAALPLLLQLGVQWPGIEYDYVREVRIEAKTRFDVSTEFIYNQVKEGMDVWNGKVQELINGKDGNGGLNFYTKFDYGKRLNEKIQEKTKEATDELFKDLKDGEIPLPGGEEIKIDVSRPGAFENFQKELESYVASLPEEVEEYRLVAEENYLDPNGAAMNRSLADLKASIAASDLPDDPLVNRLAEMRGNALAYAEGLEVGNRALDGRLDLEDFTRVLVENDESLSMFAAKDLGAVKVGAKTVGFSLFGEGVEGLIENSAMNNDSRLLAAEIGVNPADFVAAANEAASTDAQPIGVYVALPNGLSENIMNYTLELKGRTKVLFSDVDSDGDTDVLISLGGDLYLKENYLNADRRVERKGEVIDSDTEVSDHLGGEMVDGVRVDSVSNRKVEVSFGALADVVGYEVSLKSSLTERGRSGVQRFTFMVEDLSDASRPQVSLEVANGHYYVEVVGIYADGTRGRSGRQVVASPSICNDEDAPFPSLGASSFRVPIYGSVSLDASNSFDADGRVVGYYLESLPFDGGDGKVVTSLPREFFSDLNPAIDTDGDGITMNDRSNPLFVIGPFVNEGDVGVHRFVLHVLDEAGNSGEQEVTVDVFAPEISLDESFAETKVAIGGVDPAVEGVPFALMRKRHIYRVNEGKLVLVPRTEKLREGFTNRSGNYEMKGFDDEDIIGVEDAAGKVVAEINAKSGNIGALADGYDVIFESANLPDEGSKLVIVDARGIEMASVQIVLDANGDVGIGGEEGELNVMDRELGDGFVWKRISANDQVNPGGAMLVRDDMERVIAIVDASGNVVLLAPRVVVRVQKNNHLEDVLVLEVVFGGKVIAEIRVKPNGKMVFSSAEQVPAANAKLVSPASFYGGRFEDTGGVNALSAAVDLFGKDQFITRSDFTYALLELMCIVPRKPEAYSENSGYNDVFYDPDNLARDYPYIKEATFLGLIEGYQGEIEADGLAPFKPNATVNRAEAVTMILRALELKGVVNLDDVRRNGEEWYNGYLAVAEDLGLISGVQGTNPNEAMSYGELLAMVRQVLLLHSCEEVDLDGDKMSDFCEEKYGVDDPNGDEDRDLIRNKEECDLGMDPTKAADVDSDGDGLLDKMELLIYKTDPNDAADDYDAGEVRNGESGVFVVPAECNTCPCLSTLVNKADILKGDIFFPVIQKEYLNPIRRLHIFKKGNEVLFK